MAGFIIFSFLRYFLIMYVNYKYCVIIKLIVNGVLCAVLPGCEVWEADPRAAH